MLVPDGRYRINLTAKVGRCEKAEQESDDQVWADSSRVGEPLLIQYCPLRSSRPPTIYSYLNFRFPTLTDKPTQKFKFEADYFEFFLSIDREKWSKFYFF